MRWILANECWPHLTRPAKEFTTEEALMVAWQIMEDQGWMALRMSDDLKKFNYLGDTKGWKFTPSNGMLRAPDDFIMYVEKSLCRDTSSVK